MCILLLFYEVGLFTTLSSSFETCENNGLAYVTTTEKLCYWFSSQRQNADSCEYKCKSKGGNLAYIPNEEAMAVVKVLVDGLGYTTDFWKIWFFVGYTDIWNNGSLIISGTTNVQNWAPWQDGEPNDFNNQDERCIQVWPPDYVWYDIPCWESWSFLCYKRTIIQAEVTTPSVTTTEALGGTSTVSLSGTSTKLMSTTQDSENTTAQSLVVSDTTTKPLPTTEGIGSTENMSPSVSTTGNTEAIETESQIHSEITTPSSSTAEDSERTSLVPTSLTATQTVDINTISSCHYRCFYSFNSVTLQSKLLELKKELAVNKTELSAKKRKLTCASDDRPEAAGVGYVGVALLVVMLGVPVLLDCHRLFAIFPKKQGDMLP